MANVNRYFLKEHPANIIKSKTLGAPIEWEWISQSFGVIQTDNPGLIQEFQECINAKRFGVREITEEEHAAYLKKKPNLPTSWFRYPQREEIGGNNAMDTGFQVRPPAVAVPAVQAETVPVADPNRPPVQLPKVDRRTRAFKDSQVSEPVPT